MVQAYIKEGVVLAEEMEDDKVKVALDSICHTLVTGGLVPTCCSEFMVITRK